MSIQRIENRNIAIADEIQAGHQRSSIGIVLRAMDQRGITAMIHRVGGPYPDINITSTVMHRLSRAGSTAQRIKILKIAGMTRAEAIVTLSQLVRVSVSDIRQLRQGARFDLSLPATHNPETSSQISAPAAAPVAAIVAFPAATAAFSSASFSAAVSMCEEPVNPQTLPAPSTASSAGVSMRPVVVYTVPNG